MAIKESVGIIPSGVVGARRDEMANAKEFDAENVVAIRAIKCTNLPRPGPCLHPPGSPCQIPRPNPRPGPNR